MRNRQPEIANVMGGWAERKEPAPTLSYSNRNECERDHCSMLILLRVGPRDKLLSARHLNAQGAKQPPPQHGAMAFDFGERAVFQGDVSAGFGAMAAAFADAPDELSHD